MRVLHMPKKRRQKVLEVGRIEEREVAEKFLFRFSGLQLNVILIFVLAATFLVVGLSGLVQLYAIKFWFSIIVSSILLFSLSAFCLTLASVIFPLKVKRRFEALSFFIFVLATVMYLFSLVGIALAI